jgi:hypothetical protein
MMTVRDEEGFWVSPTAHRLLKRNNAFSDGLLAAKASVRRAVAVGVAFRSASRQRETVLVGYRQQGVA